MAGKTVCIKFFAVIDENSIKKLMNVVQEKLKEEVEKFVLLISSSGGNVFAGVTGYNFLKGLPIDVETHNFGMAASSALVLFCAGTKRYSTPHASFLLHGARVNFPQGAALEEKHLEERLKGLLMDMENIAGIIAASTGKSEKEVMKDMKNQKTLNAEGALEYGLVHEIKEALFEREHELISIQ